MGFFKKVGQMLGVVRPDVHNVNPEAYSELYDKAAAEWNKVGGSAQDLSNNAAIGQSVGDMLGGFADNQAGRKALFQEDMARGFSADAQNLARAKGGTGSLQNSLRMNGGMYDSQAREQARGLNDLYSQGIKDMSGLAGIQQGQQSAQAQRANGLAGVYQTELASRRGQMNTNADNENNADQVQNGRLGKTLGGVAKIAGVKGF